MTGTAGYSYFGLAPDGEVEDYQITISAAASQSLGVSSSGLLDPRAVALADERLLKNDWSAPSISPQRQTGESIHGSQGPTAPQITDLAIAEVALTERRQPKVIESLPALDEHLVDLLFEEEADLLLRDSGLVGHM